MIDKLEDLKNKTNEWQKNNDSIVDYGDKYMRNKRLEKEKSKEHSDNLLKSKKDKLSTSQNYKYSLDKGANKSNDSKSNSPDLKIKSRKSDHDDLQNSIASETQIIYDENEVYDDNSIIINQTKSKDESQIKSD